MFAEDKKRLLVKFGMGTFLVLIGVVIGVAGVLVVLAQNRPEPKDLEEVRRQYVLEYTKSEQARRGIDCSLLRAKFGDFLKNDIQPVLNARQPGQGWSQFVSADLRKQMEEQRDYFLACGRLYVAGRNGEWNGLKDLGFTVELERELTLLYTLIRFGEPDVQCDAACLDQTFGQLQEAFDKIETRVKQE